MVNETTGPAIRTRALGRRFGKLDAVRDVTLEIARGEIFGIVGPDGAGKTTLIQMLCGILDPTSGSASVLGFDTVREAAAIGERVGYMSQSFSLYGSLSVAENIEFFADLRFVPPQARREREARLLHFSRLAPFVERLARNLSGGMQKKLALATVLIHDPEILFLDEPTTGVDPISRRDFWEIVFDFLREGVTVVVATPYLDEAERCQRVALMHEGRILAADSPPALKGPLDGRMAEFWTEDQARALAALRGDPDVQDAQVFGRSIHTLLTEPVAQARVASRLADAGVEVQSARFIQPGLEDVFAALLGGSRRAAPRWLHTARNLDAPAAGTGANAAIEVVGLTRRFGAFTAVDAATFSVREGEVFGLLGPNGSGKSTTIRMLTGILPPSAGVARIVGLDVARDARRIRPLLGYMSQRFSLYDDLTVGENLDFFAGLYGIPRSERAERNRWALATVGLSARESTRTRDLPGGFRQRLGLASAILHQPRIVILDEPTSGVDPLSRRDFWDVIFALAEDGVTVLVTTHYMDEAERCQRLGVMDRGRVVATGTPAELRAQVAGSMLELTVANPLAALKVARGTPGVRQTTLYGARLHVLLADGSDSVLRAHLAAAGQPVERITPVTLTMEDVFAALIQETGAGEEAIA